MSETGTVNVNEIMKQIRNDIQEKGYTNDMLSFDDVIVDVGTGQVTKFDKVKFNEEIFNFNASLVRMMNQMNCYIDEQNDQIKELKEKIEELEKAAKEWGLYESYSAYINNCIWWRSK